MLPQYAPLENDKGNIKLGVMAQHLECRHVALCLTMAKLTPGHQHAQLGHFQPLAGCWGEHDHWPIMEGGKLLDADLSYDGRICATRASDQRVMRLPPCCVSCDPPEDQYDDR